MKSTRPKAVTGRTLGPGSGQDDRDQGRRRGGHRGTTGSDGTFTPQVVKKRQRRLSDLETVVISLFAKGLTTGEISAHFAEVYGASVSEHTASKITDRVIEDIQVWTSRPLLGVYAAVFVDAIYAKVRDGRVGIQPFYASISVASTA
jgi:putative transposase